MNIKKAAEMFDLSVDTLRYYERVGFNAMRVAIGCTQRMI